jgi:hypothetical protein
MSRARDIAVVVVCGVALATLVCVAIAAAATAARPKPRPTPTPKPSRAVVAVERSGVADAASPAVVPGRVYAPSADAEPAVVVEGALNDAALEFQLSSTWGGVAAHVAAPDTELQLAVATLPSVCGPISITYTGARASFGAAAVTRTPAAALPVLGLGPARAGPAQYASPVLARLQSLHDRGVIRDVAWVVGQDAARVTLSFGVPDAPCFSWCWTPMSTADGCYVVPLTTTASQRHTHALIDVSRWASFLPAAADASAAATVPLRTSSGCAITVRAGTYVTTAAAPPLSPAAAAVVRRQPLTCVLGISAGLDTGAFAFDLLRSRFGVAAAVAPLLTSAVRVGT